MTTILPTKFEGDDVVAWLREFDECALANGWKDEDKIKKLPAFLAEHPAVRVQSNGVVTTTVNTPDSSPNDSRKEGFVLVQSQLKGVNKVILSEGVAIPARSEMIITGKIQAKDVSQVGVIAACHSESVRHLKGLHVARLVVTPVDKTVPIRIANTTATAVELATGCKLAEFCPLIEQENVAANNVSVDCNAVKADNITHKLDSSLDPAWSNDEKEQLKQVLNEFEEIFSDTIGQTNIVYHTIDTGDNPPIRQRARRVPYAFRDESDKQIANMLDQGIIRSSTSPWASPIVLVRKKSGEIRFCVDYRIVSNYTS